MIDGKIINDPVLGFIQIPRGLFLDLVRHPLMQRLTRIKQLGLTSMVYPAAQHTRFQHSIGSFHLMGEAINSLAQKGVFIFGSEAEAVEAAILLHDIGHGPFSHVLEHTLISGIDHEEISLHIMEKINKEMDGKLNLALKIFKNDYSKKFLHQLIGSQLDMDRLDYLMRDCFFTGVAEGNIGCARIIKMLDVFNDNLVVRAKGIYTIENYLMSRHFMYWQVYLHKTTVSSEKVLVNAILRAKQLAHEGKQLFATPALRYFLYNDINAERYKNDEEAQHNYEILDDNDVWSTLKVWMDNEDKILSLLTSDIINRNLFKVEVSDEPFNEETIQETKQRIAKHFDISIDDAHYLMSVATVQKDIYDINKDQITILYENNTTKDIAEASELLNIASLSKKIRKYYLCCQRF
ncbi:MAG: HD domain-containing protein [Prevotella sp.]|nr:HD domain-containing protein [Prevotella sp.]